MIDGGILRTVVRVVLVLGLFAGGWAIYGLLTAQNGGTIVILLGRSPSEVPSKAAVAACVARHADEAIDDGATIELAMIARSPADMGRVTVTTALTFTQRTNPNEGNERRKDIAADVDNAVEQFFARPEPDYSSDVLAATVGLEPVLRAATKSPAPKLIICSDLHQTGSGTDFYRVRLTGAAAKKVLNKVRPELANLTGTDVVFVPIQDKKAALPAWRERSIQLWWRDHWAPAVGARSAKVLATAADRPAPAVPKKRD